MIFTISKTSIWGDEKPCAEAKRIMVPVYDTRTCTECEYDDRIARLEGGKKWRERGTEHTSTERVISRRLEDREGWAIEVNSLEELCKFSEIHGTLVFNAKGDASIEIYDDYRE